MTEYWWAILAAVAFVIGIETGEAISRIGLKNLGTVAAGVFVSTGQKWGILKKPPGAERTARRKILKDLNKL